MATRRLIVELDEHDTELLRGLQLIEERPAVSVLRRALRHYAYAGNWCDATKIEREELLLQACRQAATEKGKVS